MTAGTKFLVADDHPLFRGALKQAIGGAAEDTEIVEAGDFDTAKAIAAAHDDLDLILLDLSMPGASGLSALVGMRGLQAAVPVIVVSASDDPETIRRSLELGASGFISKSSSMEDMQAVVCSMGTIAQAKQVNDKREERGLKPVDVLVTPLLGVKAWGERLSSSELRKIEASIS